MATLQLDDTKTEVKDDELPLALGKYRVRQLPTSQIPILADFPKDVLKDFHTDEFLVVDNVPEKKKVKKERTQSFSDDMSVDDGKENVGNGCEGPENTSFLTMNKLKSEFGESAGMEIDLTLSQYGNDVKFDSCPMSLTEAVNLKPEIRTTETLSPEVRSKPLAILSSGSKLPTISMFFSTNDDKLVGNCKSFGKCTSSAEANALVLSTQLGSKNLTKRTRMFSNYTKLTIFEKPSADAELKVVIEPGFMDDRLWNEPALESLLILMRLNELLRFPDYEVELPGKSSLGEYFDVKFEKLMEDFKPDMTHKKHVNTIDNLWECLLNCRDMEQVSKMLTVFLEAVKYGTIVPMIDPSDEGSLVRLIGLFKTSKKIDVPHLEKLATAEMFLEMGVTYAERKFIELFHEKLNFNRMELKKVFETKAAKMSEGFRRLEARTLILLPVASAYVTITHLCRVVEMTSETCVVSITRKILELYTDVKKYNIGMVLNNYRYEYSSNKLSQLDERMLATMNPDAWSCEEASYNGRKLYGKVVTLLTKNATFANVAEKALQVENGDKPDAKDRNVKEDYYLSQCVYQPV